MKRTHCIIAVLLTAVLLLAACASSGGSTTPQSGLPDIVRNARRNAPENALVGVGSAKLASQNQSRNTAETRARAQISRSMNSMIDNMIRDYTASSEVNPEAALAFQEEITVALSRSRLQGARVADEDWIDGTYYVVVYLDKADVVKEISQAQAASILAPGFSASMFAEQRMNEAFDKITGAPVTVADRD